MTTEEKLNLLNEASLDEIDNSYDEYLKLIRSIEDDLGIEDAARHKLLDSENIEAIYEEESSINSLINDPVRLVNSNGLMIRTFYYEMSDYFDSWSKITRDGILSFSLDPNNATRAWRASADEAFVAFKQNYYGDPDLYNTSGLEDQYVCHFYFGNGKDYWNIEPSRPDVSYTATVAALCNP